MLKLRALAALLLVAVNFPVLADVSEAEIAQLKSEMMKLLSRVEALESENQSLRSASGPAVDRKNKWTDSIKVKGDLRYRYEGIDQEGRADRERNRLRARVQVTAKLPNNVEVGIGLASGSDDPISTNQSLGGGGSTKDIRLNLAYAKWQATENLELVAGKFSNNWVRPHKSELLWDSDYTPEGLALTYDRGGFFLTSAIQFLESDSRRSNHRFMWGLQSGYSASTENGKFTTAIGYHDIGAEGRATYRGDEDDFYGNAFTCANPAANTDCAYDNDYRITELSLDWSTTITGKPFSVYSHLAKNQAADSHDTAWGVGASLGKVSDRGTWKLGYRYQVKEADSVFGLLAGSDFAGGGTDSRGHIIKGNIGINKRWSLGLTYFINEQNMDFGTERDYDRIQIDSQFKF